MKENPLVLLFDGNALLYRAYHAFPNLTTPDGAPIGAVYGFTRILLSTVKSMQPDCVAVAFDLKGPTFRDQVYKEYKANRQAMPDDLAAQIEQTHQLVETLEFPIYTAQGFEADDVIGTLSKQITAELPDYRVTIVTGDQDLIQLVDGKVSIFSPASYPKQPVTYTPEKVMEKYGFTPPQMIDYKALRGDPSDNIPGVPGVGEVTATKLIQEFKTIPELYEALEKGQTDDLKPVLVEKLLKEKESALMSHTLATIDRNAPVKFDLSRCKLQLQHPEKLIGLFQELGFKSLLKELPGSHTLLSNAADIFQTDSIPEEKEDSKSREVDEELAPILRAMEAAGVKIDLPYLKKLEHEFAEQLASMKKQIIDLAGQEFNPDSPSQVSHILYEVLGIPTKFVRKGKTGYTTDADTLQELATEYPITQLLLNYREIGKLQSTYILPLQQMTDKNDRIHTSYAPDTATGRISSRNPNLQNIPVRSETGKRIRKAFIAEKGHVLVAADYSQMELRVAAHLSGDPVMQEIFKSGRDIHAETGAKMGVDRRIAKVINFSILYGKGAFGFARDMGVSMKEAKEYIEQYFDTYKVLRKYLDDILAEGRKNGYLETMFGRRRYLPDLVSSNYQRRAAAEREAVNLPIQGSQADILKIAMRNLAKELKGLESKLILTVHDELVLESPSKEVDQVAKLLADAMIHAVKLDVPVEVNLKKGSNWAELQEFELAK